LLEGWFVVARSPWVDRRRERPARERRPTRAAADYVDDVEDDEANGEDGRDGTDDNRSWDHGVEGPVQADSVGMEIVPLRRRSLRNLMGTLLLSAGTPMISAGDELGRTQAGNNNAYCQDNELSWLSWDLADWQRDLIATTKYLLLLRRENAALRPSGFFRGAPVLPGDRADLAWYDSAGSPLDHDRWHDPAVRTLQMLRCVPTGGPDQPASAVLVVINGALDPVDVTLADDRPTQWELAWDSTWEEPGERAAAAIGGGLHPVSGGRAYLEALSMRVYLAR